MEVNPEEYFSIIAASNHYPLFSAAYWFQPLSDHFHTFAPSKWHLMAHNNRFCILSHHQYLALTTNLAMHSSPKRTEAHYLVSPSYPSRSLFLSMMGDAAPTRHYLHLHLVCLCHLSLVWPNSNLLDLFELPRLLWKATMLHLDSLTKVPATFPSAQFIRCKSWLNSQEKNSHETPCSLSTPAASTFDLCFTIWQFPCL